MKLLMRITSLKSFSSWTGIPVDKMMSGEQDRLLEMEEVLSQNVVGQPEAIEAVSHAVRRARAGISDPDQPMGSSHAWPNRCG